MRHSGCIASPAQADTNGRPHWRHSGPPRGFSEARHSRQIGIRLAVCNILSQTRHGAGKTSDAIASQTSRIPALKSGERSRHTAAGYSHARLIQRRTNRIVSRDSQADLPRVGANLGTCLPMSGENRALESALFVLLLADDAMPRPGNCFKPLLLQLLVAIGAKAVLVFLDAL